jgi:hypothetical protein
MKRPLSIKTKLLATTITSLLITTNLQANSCSKADIEYYLGKGFSYDNVVKLCTTPTANTPAQSTGNTNVPLQPLPNNPIPISSIRNLSSAVPPVNQPQTNDLLILASNLKAKNIKLTHQALIFDTKECTKSDSETILDVNDKACVQSTITVNFSGLKILKKTKSILLLRDPEFIVGGNIKRDYMNINTKKRHVAEKIQRLFPTITNTYKLPVRRDSQLEQIAGILNKYITP